MQNETSLYEMPADQLLFSHERLGEGQELGEARVVSTLWGKARVRIVHKQTGPGWRWLLAALALLGIAAAIWAVQARRDADETGKAGELRAAAERQPLSQPNVPVQAEGAHDIPAMAVPAPNTPAANGPATPAPSPQVQNAPEPRVPLPTEETAAKAQPAIPRPAKPEASAQQTPATQRSNADKANKPPLAVNPPVASGERPKQAERTGQGGGSPAAAPAATRAAPEAPTAPNPALQPSPLENARPAENGVKVAPTPASTDAKPAPKVDQGGAQP